MRCCSLTGLFVWYHSVEGSRGKETFFTLYVFSLKYHWLLTVQRQCLALVSVVSMTEKWSIQQWPKFLQYGNTCSDFFSQIFWPVLAWRSPSITLLQHKENRNRCKSFYLFLPFCYHFPLVTKEDFWGDLAQGKIEQLVNPKQQNNACSPFELIDLKSFFKLHCFTLRSVWFSVSL